MNHRCASTAGALSLAVLLAVPGCSYDLKLGLHGLASAFGAADSFNESSLKESETIPAQRVEVGDAPAIVVDNRVGRVIVSSGGDGVVEVEARKRADTKEALALIKLAVEKKGNVVTIKWDTNDKSISNRAVEITVKAPRSASLELRTGNGPISITGFARGAKASTGVGSITVKEVAGDLGLSTGNGPIVAEGVAGAVEAETGVGAVTIQGPKGTRTVHTGNGPIRIDGASGAVSARADLGRIEVQHTKGDLSLHTGNGSIHADDADGGFVAETGVGAVSVSGKLAGRCRVQTGNGSIVVTLPADCRLKIAASTGNGAITNQFSLPVDGFVSRSSKGVIGDGSGGSLELETGVGSITLRKQ